jgi:hypothetical protein
MVIPLQELYELSQKAVLKYGYSEERGDRIRSMIIESNEIEMEDN